MKIDATLPDGREAKVQVKLSPGSFIVLKGRQGIGKSTILKAIALAVGDDIGEIPRGAEVRISTDDDDYSVTVYDKGGVKSKRFRFPVFSSKIFNALVTTGKVSKEARCRDRVLAVQSLVSISDEKAVPVLKKIFGPELYTRVLNRITEKLGDRYSVSYSNFIKTVKACVESLARESEKICSDNSSVISFWVEKLKDDGVLTKVTQASLDAGIKEFGNKIDLHIPIEERRMELNIERASVELGRREALELLDKVGGNTYTEADVNEMIVRVKNIRNMMTDIDKERDLLLVRKSALEAEEAAIKERGKIAVEYIGNMNKLKGSEGSKDRISVIDKKLRLLVAEENNRSAYKVLGDAKEQINEATDSRKKNQLFAENARSLIKTGMVSDLSLEDFGLNGIVIDNGDVALVDFVGLDSHEKDGILKYMDEMSEGEQVKAAFDIMAMVTEGKVIFPDRKLVSSLQPENLELVKREIKKRNMIALTEQPTDDNLTVELI